MMGQNGRSLDEVPWDTLAILQLQQLSCRCNTGDVLVYRTSSGSENAHTPSMIDLLSFAIL